MVTVELSKAASGYKRYDPRDVITDLGPVFRGFTPGGVGSGYKDRKLISNPLAMTAAARIYATALPRLLGSASGKRNNMSVKQATNDALRLIYAGRMQGHVL